MGEGELAAAAHVPDAPAGERAGTDVTELALEQLDSAQPTDSASSLAHLPAAAVAHRRNSLSSSAGDSCQHQTPAEKDVTESTTSACVLARIWR